MQTAPRENATTNDGNKKRRSTVMMQSDDKKKSKPSPAGPSTPAPHAALLEELKTKYDILPAFTISSTKIHNRVDWLLLHLRKSNGDPRKRAVLLFARPGEVGKMITISEQVKRIVADEDGSQWYQYNKMYELPPKPEVVEETMLGGDGDGHEGDMDDEDDDFEVMDSVFEKATIPQPAKRTLMSLSIFLSLAPMPELKAKEGVTQQTNDSQGAASISKDAQAG